MLKRFIDIVGALVGITLSSPLLVLAYGVTRTTLGRPVFFGQLRAGLMGKVFVIYKIRTMDEGRCFSGELLPDSERLTQVGRVLRRLSIDELPQLWNVLMGEMSLVGPRPLLPDYLPRYTELQRRRHEVRPGITGWAQVNGRNQLDWGQRFTLDVWYVDHRNVWLDARILWRTLVIVLRREGISRDGHVTMPEFMGSVPRPTESESQTATCER